MKKFFKLFFSRFALVAIAIILQVALIVVINYYLVYEFPWINLLVIALGVVTFFAIVNRNLPASFKLPYLIIVCLAPIVGVTVYGIFGNVGLSKKNRKKLDEVHAELRMFCQQESATMAKLYQISPQAYGQAMYIEQTSYLPTYENCSVKYLPMGEDFFESLIEELKKAKRYILMEYFIIEEGKMWNTIYDILKQKAKEGVEVHFMYDDVGSIGKVSNDYFYKMRNDGINACKFSPFKAFVSPVHNNRDHRKICVIDGDIGYIGGVNLADEYINVTHPYGKWKDNAVIMRGQCVDSLIWMFIQLYNPNSLKKLKISDYLLYDHPKYESSGFVAPYGDGPRPAYDDYIGQTVYSTIINQAKKYVYIITPYLIVDYDFLAALKNAVKRGVDVKILLPHIPDKKLINILTKSNYEDLIANGVEIYEYTPGFVHAKMVVADDDIAAIGTINLDYRSFVHHFECGVWLYNEKCILDMKNDFLTIVKTESELISLEKAHQPLFNRLIKDILSIIAPMM